MSASNKIIYSLFAITLLSGYNKAAAQDSLKVLSLDDCIKMAVTKSTTVLKSTNAIGISSAQVLYSYGQYLPDLTLGGGYNYTEGKQILTSETPTTVSMGRSQFDYTLVTSINIFTGLANRSQLRAALLSKKSSELNLDWAKEQISFDVTQSYLQVILDKKIVAFAQQNLTTSLKREDQLKALTDVGRKTKSDYYQQQAETSNDRLTLINAQNKLRTDKILLLVKLRISETDKYDIDSLPVNSNPLGSEYSNEKNLEQTALSSRPDLQSEKLNVDIAQQNIIKYRSGYLPKVSLNLGLYSYGGYFNNLYVNGDNVYPANQQGFGYQLTHDVYGVLGVNASWNIFDKYVTKSNVQTAKINMDNANIDYEDLKIQITTDLQQAFGDYHAALAQIVAADTGIIAASNAFETVNGRYNVGSADFVELSNAQVVLLQAQESKAQADINLMLQKRIINYYMGK